MAVRRLNHTGRRKIAASDTRFTVYAEKSRPSMFESQLALGKYGFPVDALVIVEAYRQATLMRFGYGTVGHILPPESPSLDEFSPPDGVRFRVKVVSSAGNKGQLLGLADTVAPEFEGATGFVSEGLLPVVPVALGSRAWRLHLEEGSEGPQLHINRELKGWRSLVREDDFICLVYPEILRRVLLQAVLHGRPGEDEPEWQRDWCRFAEGLPGVPEAPEGDHEDAIEEWVEEAVDRFSQRHAAVRRLIRKEDLE